MLEQHARVIQSTAEGVWVEAIEPDGCGICAGQGCSSRQIAELFQRSPRQYKVESNFNLSPGDHVVVGVPDGSVLRSALYLYGLPLLLILAGALFGQMWMPGDASAVMGALTGAMAAGGWIALEPNVRKTQWHPVVIQRSEMMTMGK